MAFYCSISSNCLAQRHFHSSYWGRWKHSSSTSSSQTEPAWDSNWWPSGRLYLELGWQRRLSTLTARQLNTMRLLALRRLAMTCQVCTSQIFTLYCLTKCTYCMSSCSLKHTDSGTLTALLSLVSSFHQFTPTLVVLSVPYTQGKGLCEPLNHTSSRSLLQMLYQSLPKTGKWILKPDKRNLKNRSRIF